MLDVFFYLTGVCVVSRRRFLPKNISITVWRPGDWGLQAGPSCSWAFSSPCASSTHWVNIDPLHQRRSSWSWHSLLPACSGLGSCSERAGVCGAEALRPVRVLLPVSSHHRSRLAFLPSTGGCGSGGARSGPGVPGPLKTSGQKERVTVEEGTKVLGHVSRGVGQCCPALHKAKFTVLLSEVRGVPVFHQGSLIWTS